MPAKAQLFEQLKNAKTDSDIPRDFECIGNIEQVYPDLPKEVLDCYRTWIWESNERGLRIATSDHGNSHLSFMCEGTPEELINYVKTNIAVNGK